MTIQPYTTTTEIRSKICTLPFIFQGQSWYLLKKLQANSVNDIQIQICAFNPHMIKPEIVFRGATIHYLAIPIPHDTVTARPAFERPELTEDEIMTLKIVIPISVLLILLVLLCVFCYCRWKEISEFWKKRTRSSVRNRDPSSPRSPNAIGLQDGSRFPYLTDKYSVTSPNPYVSRQRQNENGAGPEQNAMPPLSPRGVARVSGQTQSYVRREPQ